MNLLQKISEEVQTVLNHINEQEIETVVDMLVKKPRVFVDGEGRSGYVGRCFAMRLMHLGFEVYFMGETNTPSFSQDDLYIWISGSGTTGSVLLNATKAKSTGAAIIGVTSKPTSTLSSLSDCLIIVEATVRGDIGERKSIQLLGSLFDQSCHLLLDAICLAVSEQMQISNDDATKKHV